MRHLETTTHSLLLVAALAAGAACRTKPAPDVDGWVCAPVSGICTMPHNDGGSEGKGDAPGGDADAHDAPADAADASDAADTSDATPPPDARVDGGTGDARGTGTVVIVSPVGTVYTNGTVLIQVGFGPGSSVPPTVAILKDGQPTPLGTASAPFSFSWDTTTQPEGSYQITARAEFGGQSVTSAPVTVVVDRTKPTITNRAPAPNDVSVDLSAPILITFSEPLLPSTVTVVAVSLAIGSTPVPSTIALSADGRTVTISLTNRRALSLPAMFVETLASSITDLAGNSLAQTTWSWNAPLWISYGSMPGGSPNIALDSQRRLLIATTFERGAIGSRDYVLNIARHRTGTSWDTSFGTPQGAEGSSVVTGPGAIMPVSDDNPIVAWPENQTANTGNPGSAIHVAKWTGSAWDRSYGTLADIADPGATFAPRLARGATSNQFFVAWQQASQRYVYSAYAARWTGTTWDLSYGGIATSGAYAPSICTMLDGAPFMTWSLFGAGGGGGLSRWTGSAWAPMTVATSGVIGLALDATAAPTLAAPESASRQIAISRYTVGNGTAPAASPLATSDQPNNPRLVVDTTGAITVAWSDATGSMRNVRVARFDGTSWDTTLGTLRVGASTMADHPDVVALSDGSPIVAWDELPAGGRPTTYIWKSNH